MINELEHLEDGKDTNYADVISDLRWNVLMSKNRHETLQKRGKTL